MKNLSVPEQRNIGYRQDADGKCEIYLRDPSRIDRSKASPGYRYLAARIEGGSSDINYVLIPEGGRYVTPGGEVFTHNRVERGEGGAADSGQVAGGLTISEGGQYYVLVPEGGVAEGVRGLAGSGREVPVAQPDHLVGAHELFGELERYAPGNEALRGDSNAARIAGDDRAIAIENEIREWQGVPLRSGTDHGHMQERVDVVATDPDRDAKAKK